MVIGRNLFLSPLSVDSGTKLIRQTINSIMAIPSASFAVSNNHTNNILSTNSSLLLGVPYLRCCMSTMYGAHAARCDSQHSLRKQLISQRIKVFFCEEHNDRNSCYFKFYKNSSDFIGLHAIYRSHFRDRAANKSNCNICTKRQVVCNYLICKVK